MEAKTALRSLSALAQEKRLAVFRLLVRAGEHGESAGSIARALDVPPNTLSAQLNVLTNAGLIQRRREGRHVLYSADLDAMGALLVYLIEGCCEGNVALCGQIAEALEQVTRCP
ncbi:MAG: metalloregulator ArsR/SmtB family transcription factor [Pseudomonadota bacterium]